MWRWIAWSCLVIASAFLLYYLTVITNCRNIFWERVVFVTLAPHLYMFLLGVILAEKIDALMSLFEGKVVYWSAGYIAFCLIKEGVAFGPGVAGFVFALSQGLILAGWVISFSFSGRAASNRLLRGNDISYGVYLFHMLIINTILDLGGKGRGIWMAVVFIVTVIVATLSWKLVEKPALKLKHQAFHKIS